MPVLLCNTTMTDETSLALPRPEQVRARIGEIKTRLVDGYFELADLLAETNREGYWEDWGHDSFREWVEESDFNISIRKVYQMIAMSEKSAALGISRDVLKASSVTKLDSIFSLDVETHAETMKLLIAESSHKSIDTVATDVARLKAGEGLEPMVHKTFSFTLSAYDNTVKGAIELMQQEYGDTINSTGEIYDISPGKAIEMICADYMSGGMARAE